MNEQSILQTESQLDMTIQEDSALEAEPLFYNKETKKQQIPSFRELNESEFFITKRSSILDTYSDDDFIQKWLIWGFVSKPFNDM